jgi:hypothetical protein
MPRPLALLRLLLGASLCLTVATAQAQVAGWSTSGPELTSVNAIGTAADAEATAYVGASTYEASQSAIFKTTDGGQTWEALFEASRGEYLSAILVDPRDGQRIFAGVLGTGVTRIYRSTNSGDTWPLVHTVSAGCVPSFVAGAGPDAILFSCGTRLFRSPDAGVTWSEIPTSFTESVSLEAAGATLYAYGVTKILRSTNAGDSWTPAADAPPGCPGILVLRIDPAHPNVFLAGTGKLGGGGFQCGGVYRSVNSGTSWSASGLSAVYVTDVAIDTTDSSRIYASASYIPGILPPGGVFASSDSGASWQNLALPAPSALHLALSSSGTLLYAATSLGAYDLRIRKTRIVPPRL